MKVRIDAERCQGHGRCAGVAPELFGFDDEGFGVVAAEDVPETLEAKAGLAAANCPEGAVLLSPSRS